MHWDSEQGLQRLVMKLILRSLDIFELGRSLNILLLNQDIFSLENITLIWETKPSQNILQRPGYIILQGGVASIMNTLLLYTVVHRTEKRR